MGPAVTAFMGPRNAGERPRLGAAFWGGYLQPGDGRFLGGPPPERLGFNTLGFTDRGRDAAPLHLLQNGDSRREGPVVAPGFLTALPQLNQEVPLAKSA